MSLGAPIRRMVGPRGRRLLNGLAALELVAALKAAGSECEKAYGSITDATATQIVTGPRGARSRLGTLYGNAIHVEHESAQMAVASA